MVERLEQDLNPVTKAVSVRAVQTKMNRIDSAKPSSDVFEVETPELVSCLNFRDIYGRTPLHIATYFGNARAVEVLMFLKADSSVKDQFGYRAIDYIGMSPDVDDVIQEDIRSMLLKELHKKESKTKEAVTNAILGVIKAQTTGKKAKKGQRSLDVDDLRVIRPEKLGEMRFGIENDDYLTYAIKEKNIAAINYLIGTGVFPYDRQNSTGMTYLH